MDIHQFVSPGGSSRDTRQVCCSEFERLKELLPNTSRPVTKVWASRRENGCWEICSAGRLLGERVALQVVARRVAPYVELPSDKGLGELLLSLLCTTRFTDGT
jgi:hypothetical protein